MHAKHQLQGLLPDLVDLPFTATVPITILTQDCSDASTDSPLRF